MIIDFAGTRVVICVACTTPGPENKVIKKLLDENIMQYLGTYSHTFYYRDHPYITSAKGLGGWVQKTASFADVQYCIYADKVGGAQKGQKYADVIQGWSLMKINSKYDIAVLQSDQEKILNKQKLDLLAQCHDVIAKLIPVIFFASFTAQRLLTYLLHRFASMHDQGRRTIWGHGTLPYHILVKNLLVVFLMMSLQYII